MARSVSGVVERIGKLQCQEPELLKGVNDEVNRMIEALRSMKGFLIDLDSRKDKPAISDLVAEIRDVANDAEDAIDTFVLKTSFRRGRDVSNAVKRSACFLENGWIIHKTKSKITKITDKITYLTQQLRGHGIEESRDGEGLRSSRVQRQRLRRYYNVVGLDKPIKKLVSVLVDDTRTDSQIVSIWGMGGSGKTTLAKNVYNNRAVRDHFVGRAWVYVSRQCRRRKVWEEILYGLGCLNEKGSKRSDEDLAGKLCKFLKDNKCLVVLDDIWDDQDWGRIKAAFPGKAETGSKILLTTRHGSLSSSADWEHEMESLTEQESWELFEQFGVKVGKKILEYCDGLPLAIVVMGGLLATKGSADEWEIVLNHLGWRYSRDGGPRFKNVLALAYDDLPYYLKQCFLYLSHFPRVYRIPVVKLIQLWVSEGIVPSMQHDDEGEVIEDVAESYFIELVERCMIQVEEEEASFKIKTCYMHDMMRDICLSKADQQKVIDYLSFDKSNVLQRVPILAIHEYVPNPIQHIKNPHLKSLLFFGEIYPDELITTSLRRSSEVYLREDRARISMLLHIFKFMRKFQRLLRYLFNNFKLLRVLDFEGANIYIEGDFLNDIDKLFRLRYLSLKNATCVSKIPSCLGNLKWLQTLDLRTNEEFPIRIPDVIWKMERLIHLYLPKVCDNKTKLTLNTLINLRTLVNFNTKNCYVQDLRSMTSLGELRISGHFYIKNSDENLGSNPRVITSDHFPDQLTFKSLSETELRSDPMPVLEKLPNLRFLELQDAFSGEEIRCSTHGFPELESLKLIANAKVENWTVDDQPCMPKLRHLEIIACKSLKMLPVGLKFITTLEELKIELMPKAFKDRLVEGGDDFNKVGHIRSVIFQNCY